MCEVGDGGVGGGNSNGECKELTVETFGC